MIIITSDHGENIGDHGLMDHQYSVHESLIRVPLIIRCPGVFPVSHIIDEQVQTIDILSTLCDLFRVNGAEVESQLQGVSLLSSGPRERKAVFAEYLRPNLIQLRRRYPNHDVTKYDVAYRTVRTGDYKYIESSSGGVELYRIDEDPGETRNLSSAEQGKVREMQGVLEEWAKTARHDSERGSKRDDSRYDERTMRMLKDMGYM
jgi:arylsulfatase A-like enzyme